MKLTEWERRNEDYVAEIAADDNLTDSEYVEVLEDLIERAQSARDAKTEELSGDDDDEA